MSRQKLVCCILLLFIANLTELISGEEEVLLMDSDFSIPDEYPIGYKLDNRTVSLIYKEAGNVSEGLSLPQSVLINNGLDILSYSEKKLSLLMPSGEKYNLDTLQQNAILMALLRINALSIGPYLKTYENIKYDKVIIVDSDTLEEVASFSINWMYGIVKYAKVSNYAEWSQIPYATIWDGSTYYGRELFNILLSISGENKNNVKELKNNLCEYITASWENDNTDVLSSKYTFLKNNWEKSAKAYIIKRERVSDTNFKKVLSIDIGQYRWNALMVALMRSRLNIGKYLRVYHRKDGHFMGDGGMALLYIETPNNEYYLLYVKSGVNNVVGVRKLFPLDTDNNDLMFPEEGGYVSPELYNIVISIFADMARKEFLEKSSGMN